MVGSPSSETTRTCGGQKGLSWCWPCEVHSCSECWPKFCLLTHHAIDNGLLVTSLLCIVMVESSDDVRVVVLLPTFLVGTALA